MSAAKSQAPQYAQLAVNVVPAREEMEAPAAERAAAAPRVAVLVCHGMGQQVQFETLDGVARAVYDAGLACGTATKKEHLTVSLHPDEDRFIGRAELKLKQADGSPLDVHFYEAYWAPLTEGRITLRETLAFFVEAGFRGLRFAYRDGVFDRWMFGGRQEFEIPARRVLQLGLALWMLILVTAAFSAVSLLPLAKVTDLFRSDSADPQVATLAAVAFTILILIVLFGGLGLLVARLLGVGADAGKPRSAIDAPIGQLAPGKPARVLMAVLLGIAIVVSAVVAWIIGNLLHARWLLPAVMAPSTHKLTLAVAALAYALESLALLRFVKGFLIGFAGDVAAYVSPYKVSKFDEIRRGIQERGRRVARFIYSCGEPGSPNAPYDAVLIVGHSLGSVVAYDTLNDAINRDAHRGGWRKDSPVGAYDVVGRTKLLLTFGSPLDKTAFVFRTQKMDTEVDVREALAAAVQPMIVDYANRRARWINLWSRSDWISGPLGYYDEPQPRPGTGVCNIENMGSKLASKAHTDYWTGPLFRGVLHAALTGKCPEDVKEPQWSQVMAGLDL